MKKVHNYLYGRAFTIVTDHKPLVSLFNESKAVPTMASSGIQRWALTLAAYHYTIVFRAGRDNCTADAMSRLPLEDNKNAEENASETVLRLTTYPGSQSQQKPFSSGLEEIPYLVRFAGMSWKDGLLSVPHKRELGSE